MDQRPLYTLQLTAMPRRKRIWAPYVAGILGALMGFLTILWLA